MDGISFAVSRRARPWALLGGNGAGKTTTIAMLLGLLIPTRGAHLHAWATTWRGTGSPRWRG